VDQLGSEAFFKKLRSEQHERGKKKIMFSFFLVAGLSEPGLCIIMETPESSKRRALIQVPLSAMLKNELPTAAKMAAQELAVHTSM
jgi:hypothetical protein